MEVPLENSVQTDQTINRCDSKILSKRKLNLLYEDKWIDKKGVISLAVPKEFSFKECLHFLGRSSEENLHLIKNETIYKLFRIEDKKILVQISWDEGGSMQVEFLNFYPRESTRLTILGIISEWFDLKSDLSSFYLMAETDAILKNIIHDYYGLRLIGIPNLFEAIVWAVIGQHINLAFAYTLKKRFVENFGEKIIYAGNLFWLFPTPKAILRLSPTDLLGLQLTQNKSNCIIDLARRMENGILSKDILTRSKNLESVKKELINIRGVGSWTADYVLMKCLRDPTAFPIGDVGLQNAIKNQLNLSQKPSKKIMKELANHWGNWKAYATFYLWRTLI